MVMSQIKTGSGSEFHGGPVVDLIVANLPLEDKFRLLQQIKKENGKRSPQSMSPMSGWKDSIERAFSNQRNICDRINSGEVRLKFRRFNDEQCIIPDEWLMAKGLTNFKQLLKLCPNLLGIHVINCNLNCEEFVNKRIFNVILTHSLAKLTSLTFEVELKSRTEKLMEFLRKRNGRMEYIDDSRLKLDYGIELMESNPNLKAIRVVNLEMDFELKELSISHEVPTQLSPNGTILGLCSYFHKFNSNYRKSSADGIRLKWIELDKDVSALRYNELVTSFIHLESVSLSFTGEELRTIDINRLKVMKNLRKLILQEAHETYDETDRIGQLLPNFSKLEQLELRNVFISERTLRQLHVICPHLKRLSISDGWEPWKQHLTKETLMSISKLSKLNYFHYSSWRNQHEWQGVKGVEENRRYLNSN